MEQKQASQDLIALQARISELETHNAALMTALKTILDDCTKRYTVVPRGFHEARALIAKAA
jgi:hypothetical protein